MSTNPSAMIADGRQSSAGAMNQTFQQIQDQGNQILALLTKMQLSTLVDYNNRLTALALRQQRAARVSAAGVVGLFLVSDFNTIDQGQSTATVRIDTASATLRERRVPVTALVTSTSFSASTGTVSALNKNQTLLSVYSDSVPTGTFTLQLQQPVNLSVLTISLVAMVSNPSVTVQVSEDGLIYTPADSLSFQGDTLNAWFKASEVRFIQLILTPAQADNMSGNSYTFGITDFGATTVSYNLVSDIYFQPVTIAPETETLRFRAQGSGRLVYNLLLDNGSPTAAFQAVTNGASVTVPGVASFSDTGVSINSSGVLGTALPANTYQSSIKIVNTTTGQTIPVFVGLSPTDPHLAELQKTYAAVNGSTVTILPPPASTTDLYSMSGLTGPSSIQATLVVHLSTTDRTQTPVFQGASLEEQ